ncbi:hypothetical protein DENIS_2284 [Desulfonema ishimotonii]|uniref:Sulfatase-modifying factor enzyme-like domain-containing protein n=2 Tax=Desulfonema ishimotonii TaxID=45657 RepID=A0A401FWL5_9BACT|nr:hypothetical protein DENIS_2284 [Desulfonema ishimotonii]
MKFVFIPPGTLMMGSPEDEPERFNNETLHKVTLTKGFYMQTTTVTQEQWKAVMGNNPSYFKGCGDKCPLENVSWDGAQAFIAKLNQDGSDEYRLPTEAEWEYACRAGTDTRYYTGNAEDDLNRAGWYNANSGSKTHPAGEKEPNAFGLYDMHGNVWEWCQDWYGKYPADAVVDPIGPDDGSFRVRRGGSWFYAAGYCRSAYRYYDSPDYRGNRYGFRLALSPGQQVR